MTCSYLVWKSEDVAKYEVTVWRRYEIFHNFLLRGKHKVMFVTCKKFGLEVYTEKSACMFMSSDANEADNNQINLGRRERNQQDATNLMFIINRFMPIFRRTRLCTTAYGVLHCSKRGKIR